MRAIYYYSLITLLLGSSIALGDTCQNRGELSSQFCDNDYNLVADTPLDPNEWIDPATLIITTAPNEDSMAYATELDDLFEYLESCLNRRIIYYPLQSNSAEIESMKNGRVHIASFSSGATVAAVNEAGAVPFAAKGTVEGIKSTHMIVIVRADSDYITLADLKGTRVAHVDKTSNTGHLLALALLPIAGITPGRDYQIIFSGKHDRSTLGLKSGDYDAATIADEVLDRMAGRGNVTQQDFRILYKSGQFPSSVFSYAHNLAPKLQAELVGCFFNFEFTQIMKETFSQTDQFIPVNYEQDWKIVRDIIDITKQQDIDTAP